MSNLILITTDQQRFDSLGCNGTLQKNRARMRMMVEFSSKIPYNKKKNG